ncbi:MAG: ATP-binding protein, partial [Clostridiales bacterium]|nr:ATP-binding protein [Clostridiales bacterium]
RGFSVDVGSLEYSRLNGSGNKVRTRLEIDFVANRSSQRYYIQSALSISDEEKRQQEINSLIRVADSFKKIVVVRDNILPWHDENGILYINIEDFLLDESAMDL